MIGTGAASLGLVYLVSELLVTEEKYKVENEAKEKTVCELRICDVATPTR